MLATEMDAGAPRVMAQKIAQGEAAFHLGFDTVAIDLEFDAVQGHCAGLSASAPPGSASLSRRVNSLVPTVRR